MAETNGRVSTKEFYEAQLKTNKQIEEYHSEVKVLVSKVSGIEDTVDDLKDDIKEIRTSDRNWKGINGVVSALAGAITGFFVSK